MNHAFATLAVLVIVASPLSAQETGEQSQKVHSKEMAFDECVENIDLVSKQLGIAPEMKVDSDGDKVAHFPTEDGTLEVACSREAEEMSLTPMAE